MHPDVVWEKVTARQLFFLDAGKHAVLPFLAAFSKSGELEHHFAVAEEIRKSLAAKGERELAAVYSHLETDVEASGSSATSSSSGASGAQDGDEKGEGVLEKKETFQLLLVSWEQAPQVDCAALAERNGFVLIERGPRYAKCLVDKAALYSFREMPQLAARQRVEFDV